MNKELILAKIFFGFLIVVVSFTFLGRTFSRYSGSVVNRGQLGLAPWAVAVNEQKVTTSGEVVVLVEPKIESYTTHTYLDKKIVPGSSGYFDLKIDPTGTGVAIDYIIDLCPESLPGGMGYTKYQELNENGSVIRTYNKSSFPSDLKIKGAMPLVNRRLLENDSIKIYRFYWKYVDNDSLNTSIPDSYNPNGIMVRVTLKQSV